MFCSKCGAPMEDDAKFCPVCGTPVVQAEEAKAPETSETEAPAPDTTLPVPVEAPEVSEAEDAKDFTDFQKKAIIKVMAIICYTGIAVLLPIFLLKDKKYLRKHENNGLTLLILSAAAASIAWIPVIGWLTGIPAAVFLCVLSVMGIVRAAKGQSFDMPLIGKWFKILK